MDTPSSNPRYNYALGAVDQSGAPPFDLSQVVMRVFPLRANYHSLQLFCDRFINIAPEYSHFEPAAPYALFCVINYGHMGNVASNLGYTSQNEVLFAVPLNWYRKQHGRWTLQPRASISPFIWVDRPSSAWTGRNVFGWPKAVAWLTPGLSEWTKDPTAPRTLFTLSALVYRQLFAGQRQVPGVLLEVEHEQPTSLFEFPPNPMNPLNPWLAWPKGILRSMSAGGSLLETMTRLPAFGFPPWGEGANIVEMMMSNFGDFDPVGSLPASNTINLKQFRQPSHPQSISYQAIVNSKMTPKSFSRGGMLGESGLMRGDLAAGYRIRIHRRPGWPIIESLGLEVSHETRHDDHNVATLEPVLPFWVDVDFEYGRGEVICWRTRGAHWSPPPGVEDSRAPKAMSQKERAFSEFRCETCGSPHLFNTAEGTAVQQVYGPFNFLDTTIRVLPLMADWGQLKTFTDRYLNFPDGDQETQVGEDGRLKICETNEDDDPRWGMPDTPRTGSDNLFVPWGSYVYMTITNYEEITSELNVGWWARRRVTFSYPVKWYQWVQESADAEGHWALKSFGVVSPYMYVDTTTAATVGREMQGWPVAEADIDCPPTQWLFDGGRTGGTDIMALRTDVMPALNANQATRRELVVEVTTRPPVDDSGDEAWLHIERTWGEDYFKQAEAKSREAAAFEGDRESRWDSRRKLTWLKSIAMEVLFQGMPVNHIALKQFRDAKEPDEACLQALNVYPEAIQRIHDLRSIDEVLHVAVHHYPTAPIVKDLGLKVKWTDLSQGQPVHYLQAIRPFWMRADVEAKLGRDVRWRAGSTRWRDGDAGELYFDSLTAPAVPPTGAELVDGSPTVGPDLSSELGRKQLKKDVEEVFGKPKEERSAWFLTRRSHNALLRDPEVTLTPQVAIESILNHRWANFGPDLLYPLQEEEKWSTLLHKAAFANGEAAKRFFMNYQDEATGIRERLRPSADDTELDGEAARLDLGPYWLVGPPVWAEKEEDEDE